MVWGAISWFGVGELTFIDGKMDAKTYKNILSISYVKTLADHNYTVDNSFLVQDNDPKHTALSTKQWLASNNIRALPWPSCSPDLNPIEHVWNYVDDRIREREILPTNLAELLLAIQDEWYKVSLDYIRSLIESMPRRIQAVSHARGGYTKY